MEATRGLVDGTKYMADTPGARIMSLKAVGLQMDSDVLVQMVPTPPSNTSESTASVQLGYWLELIICSRRRRLRNRSELESPVDAKKARRPLPGRSLNYYAPTAASETL